VSRAILRKEEADLCGVHFCSTAWLCCSRHSRSPQESSSVLRNCQGARLYADLQYIPPRKRRWSTTSCARKSRLAEVLDLEAVSYATASCGSGGVSYFAATGGSNADSGITYVLGVSEAGLQDENTGNAICEASESLRGSWGSPDNSSSTLDFVQIQKAKVVHQTAIIDTFAVTAPFVSLDEIQPPGPSISDIVAVEPNATE
jgi:hypothetical protein